MKQRLLDKIAIIGKVLALTLALSATVVAAPVVSKNASSGAADFNHATTGFPLTGAHAVAVCETCHVGGIFKGAPRDCDGCHAVGRRIVATPKSAKHIITNAACDTCHFNTVTFLGARFNHGTAQRGGCATCHNGAMAQGRSASHSSGKKLTDSCDNCHRTFAWIPASWNHVGVAPGTCTTCHNDSNAIGKPASHTTIAKATYQCDECHSFIGWIPAKYKHNTPGVCSGCHNNSIAIGKPVSHGSATIKGINPCEDCHKVQGWLPAIYSHNAPGLCAGCHDGVKAVGKNTGHIATTDDCNSCHTSTVTWSGALGAKPVNHIPYNSGTCTNCHAGGRVVTGATLHVPYLSGLACTTCHLKGTTYLGSMEKKSVGHEGMKSGDDCSKSGCHKPLGGRGTAYLNWD